MRPATTSHGCGGPVVTPGANARRHYGRRLLELSRWAIQPGISRYDREVLRGAAALCQKAMLLEDPSTTRTEIRHRT